jgi:type IV secretory pathway VirB10-like protein
MMLRYTTVRSGKVSAQVWDIIKASLPTLGASFISKGFITEDEMNVLGLPVYPDPHNSVPKDQRPMQNQRAVVINKDEAVTKYKNYKTLREQEVANREQRRLQRELERPQREANQLAQQALREQRKANTAEKRRNAEQKKRDQEQMTRAEKIEDNKRRKTIQEQELHINYLTNA